MSKCVGCGAILQSDDSNGIGYVKDLARNLCERCFRIRNYNEYKSVVKDNNDFINILKNINKTNELVVLVVDLFNINKSINQIKEYLNNNILLVLTKRDLLPKSCYDKKIIEYFNSFDLNIVDTVIVSSIKNYNFDLLFEKINLYKKSNKVYVVGFTNAGKSTLINKILYNYSDNKTEITTSNLPSTTIDSIEVKINDNLELVDTPGLLDDGDITNHIDSKLLKKIIPIKEIKPITYQIKERQIILIDEIVRLDLKDTNITLYISNKSDIRRLYKTTDLLTNLKKHVLKVLKGQEIVIQGFGFISISKDTNVILYTLENVSVYVRKGLL